MPSVSIIVNNYNYEAHLKDAIDSALRQTHLADEVIVVDDGSTDSSPEIIKSYGERIFGVFQDNAGQAAAINRGYTKSHGDIIIFLDADDRLKENAVEEILKHWAPDYSKLHFPVEVIDEEGKFLTHMPVQPDSLSEGALHRQILQTGNYNWMPTSANAYGRSCLDAIMPIPADDFTISADLYLSLRCVAYGKVGVVRSPLSQYRAHSSNRYGSHLFFAPSLSALQARAQSAIARLNILKEECERASFQPDHPSEVQYIPLSDWFDLTLEKVIFKEQSVTRFSKTDLYKWAVQRIEYEHELTKNPMHQTVQRSVFTLLKIAPAWALRALRWIGSYSEPFLRKIQNLVRSQQ